MLQLSQIREERKLIEEGLNKRNFGAIHLLDEIVEADDLRKSTQFEMDQLKSDNNKASASIGALYKEGKHAEAEALKNQVVENKDRVKQLEDGLAELEDRIEQLLFQIPNVPHNSVPKGKDAEDNEVFKAWAKELPIFEFDALPHWELAKKYNIIDFELGVKITGAGFPVYINKGAKLQRALINFFLDEAEKAGYVENQVPHVVNEESGKGTGQLPDKEGQMYYIGKDDLYLIPTAEVPLTNLYRDVILEEKELPIKITGYTPCFRREAGSYGAHVRGLNRLHQFDKVEIVQIQHPDKSYDSLMEMVAHVESLLEKLELPFRILRLCGGDMGFASALTFDFETYSGAQQRWLEVSSVSNFETFQSNRLKLRFRNVETKKTQLAHTLNGSALALPRIVATILENNQTPEGIRVPEVLKPYLKFDFIK